MRTGTHAVRLSGVGKTFGQGRRAVTALDGVDLDVAPGEFVCLLGASGCGKTTVLNLVAGLDAPSAGEIELNTSRPAVMFQEAALMPWLTASRNVELPLRLAGVKRADRRARAGELLELVRLGGVGDKRPHELSGGMRQRVALARALASAVDGDANSLLLMDEPFSALDAITRDVLQSRAAADLAGDGDRGAVRHARRPRGGPARAAGGAAVVAAGPGRAGVARRRPDAAASRPRSSTRSTHSLHEVISSHA